jgi:hypothetical protein
MVNHIDCVMVTVLTSSVVDLGALNGLIASQASCILLLNIKVCQWLATGRCFSPGTPVSSINKTHRHDMIEILLKVALKHHRPNKTNTIHRFTSTQHTIPKIEIQNKHGQYNYKASECSRLCMLKHVLVIKGVNAYKYDNSPIIDIKIVQSYRMGFTNPIGCK